MEKSVLTADKRIKAEPIAWKRRYFIPASVSCSQEEWVKIGIKEIIFNSKDIQIINQWEEDRAINVLETRVKENKNM